MWKTVFKPKKHKIIKGNNSINVNLNSIFPYDKANDLEYIVMPNSFKIDKETRQIESNVSMNNNVLNVSTYLYERVYKNFDGILEKTTTIENNGQKAECYKLPLVRANSKEVVYRINNFKWHKIDSLSQIMDKGVKLNHTTDVIIDVYVNGEFFKTEFLGGTNPNVNPKPFYVMSFDISFRGFYTSKFINDYLEVRYVITSNEGYFSDYNKSYVLMRAGGYYSPYSHKFVEYSGYDDGTNKSNRTNANTDIFVITK